MYSSDINERLLAAIDQCHFQEALSCILKGARATYISPYCGRTPVGAAAIMGDTETLDMLIQSCDDTDLNEFRLQARRNSSETDTTPEDMANLEWEDEFNTENYEESFNSDSTDATSDDNISLYYYYAKTFERTGALIEPEFSLSENNVHDNYQTHKKQDPHTPDAMRLTPLHYACTLGHVTCVEKLLQHGAPIDVCNGEGSAALHLGIQDIEITRLLIKYGANTNLKQLNSGLTALHLAIQQHCAEVAMILLDTNVNINETDENDQTPLMYALRYCMDDVARKLIERGARINLHDCKGNTALLFAVRNDSVAMVKLLLERGARRITDHYLLHYCVSRHNIDMAKLLLENDGNSLYVRNRDGYTPKLLAIVNALPEMLEFLLAAEAEWRIRQARNECRVESLDNELLLAVQHIDDIYKFKLIARLLLAYLPNCRRTLYACDRPSTHSCYIPYCQTPLSRAINLQRLDIARWLICEGANIEQICRDHVVNNLRATVSAKSIAFGNLLVNAGFRFPYKSLHVIPPHWNLVRYSFEKRMKNIATQPLTLQSYARLAIRRRLLHNLNLSCQFQLEHQATKQQSALERCIEQLGLPKILNYYLNEYADIPHRIYQVD